MKAQEIFDTVAAHLLKQGVRSEGPSGGTLGCAYRGDEGRTCAVGCMIPDELYDEKMEGAGVATLMSKFPEIKKLLGARNLELLENVQRIHDVVYFFDWRESLKALGRERHLSLKVLEAA